MKYAKINKFILKDNLPINIMYKVVPDNVNDTGWRMISGDENNLELSSNIFELIAIKDLIKLKPEIKDKLNTKNNIVQFGVAFEHTLNCVWELVHRDS